jgi:hypothetical protein
MLLNTKIFLTTFQASLKFVDLGERYTLPKVGTKEYTDLQTRIAKSMNEATLLPKVPGFQDVVITKLKRFVLLGQDLPSFCCAVELHKILSF